VYTRFRIRKRHIYIQLIDWSVRGGGDERREGGMCVELSSILCSLQIYIGDIYVHACVHERWPWVGWTLCRAHTHDPPPPLTLQGTLHRTLQHALQQTALIDCCFYYVKP